MSVLHLFYRYLDELTIASVGFFVVAFFGGNEIVFIAALIFVGLMFLCQALRACWAE